MTPDHHDADELAEVVAYHDATKHHPGRYARSLGYLDWDNQPDPFRRYAGAPEIPLPWHPPDPDPPWQALFRRAAVPPALLTRRSLGTFLGASLGLSAWKQYKSSRWALRCNPSSGNLHPTEGYLILPPVPDIASRPGVYHYAPLDHALEQRCLFEPSAWPALAGTERGDVFLAALTSVFWREEWKYGERAFRYCQHDIGHALAALRFAAAMLGWHATLVEHLADADLASLLGTDRDADYGDAEREHPEALILVSTAAPPAPVQAIGLDAVAALAQGSWHGRANRLSRDRVRWEIIERVAAATTKPRVPDPSSLAAALPANGAGTTPPADVSGRVTEEEPHPRHAQPRDLSHPTAWQIVQQRRSAVAFDGRTAIDASTLAGMLASVLPTAGHPVAGSPAAARSNSAPSPPWDLWPWPPCVHLVLFVHRVEGLRPGLYALVRRQDVLPDLRRAMRSEFSWDPAEGTCRGLPLFLLMPGDCRRLAMQLALFQDIAGDSALSLAMVADFQRPLRLLGPWFYRRLHWEAGLIGQTLYLQAEARRAPRWPALRATGIGAFFDDLVHDLLGLKGHDFQDLYHFTIGGAVEDPRLTTLPPYGPKITTRR